MKRHTLVLALACLLPACGPTDENKSQAEALEKFEKAFELRKQAESGVIAEPLQENPKISELRKQGAKIGATKAEYKDTIEDYRQLKQEEAVAALGSISVRQPGQQMAAKLFVGETRASAARKLARDASTAWASQGSFATRLIDNATAIRLNSSLGAKYDAVSFDKHLAEAQKTTEQQKQEQEKLGGEVNKLQGQDKELESQIAGFTATARQSAEESDDLSRRAFGSRGQARYGLYVKSGEAKNTSDAATAKADHAKNQLAITKAELAVQEKALKATQDQVKALDAAVLALQDRAAKTKKLAADAKGKADELMTKEFQPVFEAFTKTQAEKINKPFDEALTAMADAVSNAEAAAGQAPTESRDAAQMHMLAAKAELGHMNRQQLLADTGYRQVLLTLQENLKDVQPDLAKSIDELITKPETGVDARIKGAKERATKELTPVVDQLTGLAEQAKGGGNANQERLALQHLIHVHRALAAITGDKAHSDKADGYTQRLGEIKSGT